MLNRPPCLAKTIQSEHESDLGPGAAPKGRVPTEHAERFRKLFQHASQSLSKDGEGSSDEATADDPKSKHHSQRTASKESHRYGNAEPRKTAMHPAVADGLIPVDLEGDLPTRSILPKRVGDHPTALTPEQGVESSELHGEHRKRAGETLCAAPGRAARPVADILGGWEGNLPVQHRPGHSASLLTPADGELLTPALRGASTVAAAFQLDNLESGRVAGDVQGAPAPSEVPALSFAGRRAAPKHGLAEPSGRLNQKHESTTLDVSSKADGSREQVPLNTVAAIRTGLNQAEGGASNAGESAQKASAIPTREKLQSGGPTSSGQASSPRGGEEAGATSSDVENVGPAPSGVTEAGATQRHVADAAAQSAVQPKRSHVSGNAVAHTPSAMMEGARSVVEPSVKTVAERPAAAEAKPDRARGRSVAAVGGSDAAASLRGSDQRTVKTDVRRPDAQEDTAAVANEDAPEDKSARVPVQPRIAVSNAEAAPRGEATHERSRWTVGADDSPRLRLDPDGDGGATAGNEQGDGGGEPHTRQDDTGPSHAHKAVVATPESRMESPTAVPPTPVAWRPSASSMTPDVIDRLSDPLAAALVDESTGNRLSIKVDLGELGVVQVAANRSANGIELALVVQSQAASQALEQQSQMLLSSLQQGGIRVVGIEVRCDGERGTGFARKRGEPSRIEPKATAAASGRQATPKKPGDQRVDVLA